jgi:glyoxylase-like metal-dependent hydrolase (beta-lactamase superfamily II)
MRQLAPNVWQLGGLPPNLMNVYLIGDVLIDAATRWAGQRILRQLSDRKLTMLALTHVHPDHQGVAQMICERYSIPLACHAEDVPTMQGERRMQPDSFFIRFVSWLFAGPAYPVARILQEGDEVAGFQVIHTPGHTPGHVILFRDDDRLAATLY